MKIKITTKGKKIYLQSGNIIGEVRENHIRVKEGEGVFREVGLKEFIQLIINEAVS